MIWFTIPKKTIMIAHFYNYLIVNDFFKDKEIFPVYDNEGKLFFVDWTDSTKRHFKLVQYGERTLAFSIEANINWQVTVPASVLSWEAFLLGLTNAQIE